MSFDVSELGRIEGKDNLIKTRTLTRANMFRGQRNHRTGKARKLGMSNVRHRGGLMRERNNGVSTFR